ncbi:RNA-binding protein, partial [Striga asiatica]
LFQIFCSTISFSVPSYPKFFVHFRTLLHHTTSTHHTSNGKEEDKRSRIKSAAIILFIKLFSLKEKRDIKADKDVYLGCIGAGYGGLAGEFEGFGCTFEMEQVPEECYPSEAQANMLCGHLKKKGISGQIRVSFEEQTLSVAVIVQYGDVLHVKIKIPTCKRCGFVQFVDRSAEHPTLVRSQAFKQAGWEFNDF